MEGSVLGIAVGALAMLALVVAAAAISKKKNWDDQNEDEAES